MSPGKASGQKNEHMSHQEAQNPGIEEHGPQQALPGVPIRGEGEQGCSRAERLSRELGFPILQEVPDRLHLVAGASSLFVCGRLPGEEGRRTPPYMCPDLSRLDISSGPGRCKDQPLLKAILGRKKGYGRVVYDLTAGLGEDAWILSASGCSLVAVERDPVIFALLRDALARAGIEGQVLARRIHLVHAQAQDLLLSSARRKELLLPQPDVLYMDPFFVSERRRRGMQKRSMRILRWIGEQEAPGDSQDLLDAGMRSRAGRVVLKRPRHSTPLNSRYGPRIHAVQGRGFRFDIYQPF